MFRFFLPFFSRPLWNLIAVVLLVAVVSFFFQRGRRKKAMREWEAEDEQTTH